MIKPILFNTEMVRALQTGAKTVTRRVVKPQPKYCKMSMAGLVVSKKPIKIIDGLIDASNALVMKPPYRPGDILYVRETWAEMPYGYVYCADNESPEGWDCDDRWRPSIHMPREAARIFLRVTAGRVERLQDITEAQAVAEGFEPFPYEPASVGFVETWNEMIKPSGRALYSWDANPWVWVIEFEHISREEARTHA